MIALFFLLTFVFVDALDFYLVPNIDGETIASSNTFSLSMTGDATKSSISTLTSCTMNGNDLSNSQLKAHYASFVHGDTVTSSQCKFLAKFEIADTSSYNIRLCAEECMNYNMNTYPSTGDYCNHFTTFPCDDYDFSTKKLTGCTRSGGSTNVFTCVIVRCPEQSGSFGAPFEGSIKIAEVQLPERDANGVDIGVPTGEHYNAGTSGIVNWKWWYPHQSIDFSVACVPPTPPPTKSPTRQPTPPTASPTGAPTKRPTEFPTGAPTKRPTPKPTTASPTPPPVPTKTPTESPSRRPTGAPTSALQGEIDSLFVSTLGFTCGADPSKKHIFTSVSNGDIGCYLKCRDEHLGQVGTACVAFHTSGTTCTTFSECLNIPSNPAIGTLYVLTSLGAITRAPTGSPTRRPTPEPVESPTTSSPTLKPTIKPTSAPGLVIKLNESQAIVFYVGISVTLVVFLFAKFPALRHILSGGNARIPYAEALGVEDAKPI